MDVHATALFEVSQVRELRWRSIVIRGELDLGTADLMMAACHGLSDPVVIVDLVDLTFIDCSGYRALMAVVDSIGAAGGRILTVGARGQVARFLRLIGHDSAPTSTCDPASATATGERRHHHGRWPTRRFSSPSWSSGAAGTSA